MRANLLLLTFFLISSALTAIADQINLAPVAGPPQALATMPPSDTTTQMLKGKIKQNPGIDDATREGAQKAAQELQRTQGLLPAVNNGNMVVSGPTVIGR